MDITNFKTPLKIAKILNTNRSSLFHVCDYLNISWQIIYNGKQKVTYLTDDDFLKVEMFYKEHPYPKTFFSELTNLKKYGYKSQFQRPDVHNEAVKKSLSKESRKKQADTRREKYMRLYGVPYNPNIVSKKDYKEIYKKASQTMLKKCGYDNIGKIPGQNKKNHQKFKNSLSEEEYSENYKKRIDLRRERYGDSLFDVKKHEEKMLKKWGVKSSNQIKEIRQKQAKKYLYNGMNFDSFPELGYYLMCISEGKNIEREPCELEYFEKDGTRHVYIPDFRVDGILVEIKGKHFFNKDCIMFDTYKHQSVENMQAKQKCMIDNNVVIINDFTDIFKFLKENNIDKNTYRRL